MKKTYKIEVDCAACALKMEDAAKKVEGVTDATVSFMTQKMKVEFADGRRTFFWQRQSSNRELTCLTSIR